VVTFTEDTPGIISDYLFIVFEKDWGFKFPASYRDFLLKHNGGRPEPDSFSFMERPGAGSTIQYFFGFTTNYMNLLTMEKRRGERILKRLFPIANDCGGNLIFISVMNPDRGKIYFWDHNQETDPPDDSNLTLIADSFEEFLAGLHEPPE
jgi:hypothetical protein